MSTTKLDTSGVFQPITVQSQSTQLSLPAHSVRICKNGVEFLSAKPVPTWTEMTVDLHSARDAKKVRATGIVVECNGNRHSGYSVSMVFINLSRQSQERLSQLAYSSLA